MSAKQHTPGPWIATNPDGSYHDVIRIYASGREKLPVAVVPQQGSAAMAVLTGKTNDTTEAACNARIIAAAPELLDSLENLIIGIGMGWDLEGMIEVAQAAIDKAKGGAA